MASSSRKIIVGIDFGTTYSGLAWAETQRPDRRSAITTWPISKYHGNDVQWGFSVPLNAPDDEVLQWFKLDLDPSLHDASVTEGATSQGRKKKAEDLVRDYLSQIGDHLHYVLREKLGTAVLNSIPLEFVVTVPAIWSDLAKDKTRMACLEAKGLQATGSNLHLISEPEAAATYALYCLDPHGLHQGDNIAVVDAGGGTVDLISYTICQLNPTLEVEESAPGSGGLCGSTFLNVRFENFLKDKLANVPGFDNELLGEAVEAFEKKIKRHYTSETEDDEDFFIPVGGMANDKSLGISRGRFALKGFDIREIFEPVINEIIKLIKAQITSCKQPPRAILLVGGFGSSIYLKERARKAVVNNIRVLQPPNAWQAIVQGAVMRGLANSDPDKLTMVRIKDRKARRHYGIEVSLPYNELAHRHILNQRYWSSLRGHYRVNVMNWFIKRGEVVSENKPMRHELGLLRSVAEPLEVSYVKIYTSDIAIAPELRNGHVKEVTKLRLDLNSLPQGSWSLQKEYHGRFYYRIVTTIFMTCLSASTQYSLYHGDVFYDSVYAEYV